MVWVTRSRLTPATASSRSSCASRTATSGLSGQSTTTSTRPSWHGCGSSRSLWPHTPTGIRITPTSTTLVRCRPPMSRLAHSPSHPTWSRPALLSAVKLPSLRSRGASVKLRREICRRSSTTKTSYPHGMRYWQNPTALLCLRRQAHALCLFSAQFPRSRRRRSIRS